MSEKRNFSKVSVVYVCKSQSRVWCSVWCLPVNTSVLFSIVW